MRQIAVPIDEPSRVAEARRAAVAMAKALSLDEGTAALVATELATNVLKHAKRGALLMRPADDMAGHGLELLSIDKGPGMSSVADSMRDGHSTAGSLGVGLGALGRVDVGLEIYSTKGGGTLLRCVLRGSAAPRLAGGVGLGIVCLPVDGESECGDDWSVLRTRAGNVVAMVLDGLGHGPDAAASARAGTAALAAAPDGTAAELLERVHDAMKPTRGGAGALAVLRPERETLTFCGVGNIVGLTRAGGKVRHLVSHNGTLGHQIRKMKEFDSPFPKGTLFLMHSDGIKTHWQLDDYPGLDARHPALIAAALYRDHDRGRDDRTVLVLRNGGQP